MDDRERRRRPVLVPEEEQRRLDLDLGPGLEVPEDRVAAPETLADCGRDPDALDLCGCLGVEVVPDADVADVRAPEPQEGASRCVQVLDLARERCDPDEVVRRLDEAGEAEPLLGRPSLLGHVARDRRHGDDRAGRVPHRREGQVDVDEPAVLPPLHRLEVVDLVRRDDRP